MNVHPALPDVKPKRKTTATSIRPGECSLLTNELDASGYLSLVQPQEA
jgi:hypothetical protein